MTDNNKGEKKTPILRTFDKRESQIKIQKEKEEEEARITAAEFSGPNIYYEGEEVNDLHIWLDALDLYATIYIGPFISKDGKHSSIGLRYTTDNKKHAKISNDEEDEIMSDWRVPKFNQIIVRHNKLNNGLIIEMGSIHAEKFGLTRVKKHLYIPMSRVFHIATNENPHNNEIIEK